MTHQRPNKLRWSHGPADPGETPTFQLFDCKLVLTPQLMGLAANRILPLAEGPAAINRVLAAAFDDLGIEPGFTSTDFEARAGDRAWVSTLLATVVCATLWGITQFPALSDAEAAYV